jgi:uncharacterized membrane protein YjfL (UPF0719 family)
MGPFQLDGTAVLIALAHLVLGIVVLILAKLAKDWLSPYSTDRELTEKDNPAFGLALAGYYGAVVLIYIGAVRLTLPDLSTRALAGAFGADLGWSVAGIAALAFSRWLMNLSLLGGIRFSETIVSGRNLAAGAVECGVYLASGIVVASVVRQPGGTIATVLVFFLLSEGVLLLFGRLYERLAGYHVTSEIRDGNLAAGVALGLTLTALSLLIVKASSGEFVDWQTNLSYFAFDATAGFILLLILRWLTDLALLPNARIAEEVARDRNVNAGLIEGVIAVGIAALILFVF